ncbi:MAG: putative L-lactate dehydrogenase [Alphaproteobacteria bacterium MarineAlpha5_Bin9]|nr:MAG: putative L-lactate dehydrogenase [Alphaproteobacteria bacterium MarineAlpha5_Bin9]|tara:strand:- start:3238 stop:4392 length:1155 start_codon:yes stop_codon:yes gene_type:complete
MLKKINKCHNTKDFRKLAKKRLPSPIFHYIDGGSDDEVTYRRNTESFEECDLVPNVLAGVENIDMSTEIMGKKIDMPIFLAPTALQRLFHHDGEKAVARAAQKFNTMFGVSSLGTTSIEDIDKEINTPKLFQLYVHKDKGLTRNMIDRCKEANFDAMALTVDTIVGGNRERDLYTGFTYPPKLTFKSLFSFAWHLDWSLNFLMRSKFELSQIKDYINEGTSLAINVGDYFTKMIDQSMDWKAAEEINKLWGKKFALKGIMSVEDARKAVDIGASTIILSNHGGRQLDGSRTPFDQLSEIVDAVGHKIEIVCEGGIRRGTHILKALSLGANACSGGRFYLYALAAGGQAGVERALSNIKSEILRDMKLMGVNNISQLSKKNIRFR